MADCLENLGAAENLGVDAASAVDRSGAAAEGV
jgi:hypothetical protein